MCAFCWSIHELSNVFCFGFFFQFYFYLVLMDWTIDISLPTTSSSQLLTLQGSLFSFFNWFFYFSSSLYIICLFLYFFFNLKQYLLTSFSLVKNLPAMQETQVWSLGWEDPLEEEMATHSSILAWKIPWTEEPGGLQSMGWQRVGHNWVTNAHLTFCDGM